MCRTEIPRGICGHALSHTEWTTRRCPEKEEAIKNLGLEQLYTHEHSMMCPNNNDKKQAAQTYYTVAKFCSSCDKSLYRTIEDKEKADAIRGLLWDEKDTKEKYQRRLHMQKLLDAHNRGDF